jgi:hypothetical protein
LGLGPTKCAIWDFSSFGPGSGVDFQLWAFLGRAGPEISRARGELEFRALYIIIRKINIFVEYNNYYLYIFKVRIFTLENL